MTSAAGFQRHRESTSLHCLWPQSREQEGAPVCNRVCPYKRATLSFGVQVGLERVKGVLWIIMLRQHVMKVTLIGDLGLKDSPPAQVGKEPQGAHGYAERVCSLGSGEARDSRVPSPGTRGSWCAHPTHTLRVQVSAPWVAEVTVCSGDADQELQRERSRRGGRCRQPSFPGGGDRTPGRQVEGRTYPCTPWTE